VTCYDAATGKLVWFHATQARHETVLGGVGPRSTPTVHAGRVFALGATGELACLDLATGRLIWRDNLLDRFGIPRGQDEASVAWGRAGSPLVVDNLVVVPAGGPAGGRKVSLAAYHQETGALAWEGGDQQISYSSPALATLAGVRQVLSVNESSVTGHDPATGQVLWTTKWEGNSTRDANCSQPVPLPPDLLFVSKGYGTGAALVRLSTQSGGLMHAETLWENSTVLKTKFTNVVVYQEHVYGLSDGTLECVELATGRQKWKRGRYGQGQILGVGGVILVLAEYDILAMVEASPNGFRELGRVPALGGKTWNNLCLSGTRLLIRNGEEAAAFELKRQD
jgi:outer membrane protein assembly factor BamB